MKTNNHENKALHTTFGLARIEKGYYRIRSSKEGNRGKYLHRLIYEKYHGITLPRNIHVHHKDGNKLNNCILNLETMSKAEHHRLHSTGAKHSLSKRINIGKSKNTSGYFRVYITKNDHYKKGFGYVYEFHENGKRYSVYSATIDGLEDTVKQRNWPWIKYEEEAIA